jgi:hypothetical protein
MKDELEPAQGKLQMKDIVKRHHLKHSKKAGAVNHNCGM